MCCTQIHHTHLYINHTDLLSTLFHFSAEFGQESMHNFIQEYSESLICDHSMKETVPELTNDFNIQH